MSRNIVVCCDGTGNQLSAEATNVMRLWSALVLDEHQLGFYDPGVGTLGDPRVLTPWRRQLRKRLDGAIGYSIRENFIDAYTFIARAWQPGDRIFLFGFSRGAYTARAVAAAIHMFGLAQPEHGNLTPYIWRTFSNDDGDEDSRTLFATAGRFKRRFTREVPIHFVGVWDTVSSFGFITSFRTLPYTRGNPSVAVLRHAVSIDERRACFRANLCQHDVRNQDFKEVWFAGVHSDVGGGYPEEQSGLSKYPLRWMLGEAAAHGLRLDPDRCRAAIDNPPALPTAMIHESLRRWWRVLEFLPQRRWYQPKRSAPEAAEREKGRMAWRPPNFGRRRIMQPDPSRVPCVHESVRERQTNAGYAPANLPRDVQWVADSPAPF